MLDVSVKPILESEFIKGNALRINKCLIWFDFGIENELKCDKSLLSEVELPHIILLTNYTKRSIGGLPLLSQILRERRVSQKIPIVCTEPVFRFGNNVLLDIIKSMNIREQERGIQYTCSSDSSRPGFMQLPYSTEDIEGIFSENVCRLRYYQSFNIQLFENRKEHSGVGVDTNLSRLRGILLKALPSGVELGSTIWSVTVNSESGNKEFVYVNDTVSHPYWHVTPSDMCRLNKPDILLYGFDVRYANTNGTNYLGTKRFSNRVVHIQKLIGTLLHYLKKNKNGTILIPIQLDSFLLELLCYIDAIWSKNNIVFPVFIVSPLIKSFMLSVKTLIEWMSLEIRTEFCNSRYNPFHNLKNIYCETSLRNIRNEGISKLPKIVFAFPESLDYGYSRELFTELSSNEDNTVIFLKEPEKDTFAHSIWSRENEFNINAGCADTRFFDPVWSKNEELTGSEKRKGGFEKTNTSVFGDENSKSYSIELPMVRFIQYRQDELYAMYLSYKDSNGDAGSSSGGNVSADKSGELSSVSDVKDDKADASSGSSAFSVLDDSRGEFALDKTCDFEMCIDAAPDCKKANESGFNSRKDVLLSANGFSISSTTNIKDTVEYKKNQSVSSSIQGRIENLRSKLVPVNLDHEITTNIAHKETECGQIVSGNSDVKAGKTASSTFFISDSNRVSDEVAPGTRDGSVKRDDYGCLLDNNTLCSIIGSWKDASSDVDISSYCSLNSCDIEVIRGENTKREESTTNNRNNFFVDGNGNIGTHCQSVTIDNKRALVPRRRIKIDVGDDYNSSSDTLIENVYGLSREGLKVRDQNLIIGNEYEFSGKEKRDFGHFSQSKSVGFTNESERRALASKVSPGNRVTNKNSIKDNMGAGVNVYGVSNATSLKGNEAKNNGFGLVQLFNAEGASSFSSAASNLPEWRVHYRQLLGGSEPYKTTFERRKLEVRCKVVFATGFELENNFSSLLPLLNSSGIKLMVLLSNCRNSVEQSVLSHCKSLLMSMPNAPNCIINPSYGDAGLVEFSVGRKINYVKFDNSVWEYTGTGTFQLINDYSSPSASLIESNNNYDSMSSYFALFRLDNLTAKVESKGKKYKKVNGVKVFLNKRFVVYRKGEAELASRDTVSGKGEGDALHTRDDARPYSVLAKMVGSARSADRRRKSRAFKKEILLSNSRGLRHIVSEFRKQNPVPVINMSPNKGIVSINGSVALSSCNRERGALPFGNTRAVGPPRGLDAESGSGRSFRLDRGEQAENKSGSDANVWSLHSTLHPYYYIARAILRNQFAIL